MTNFLQLIILISYAVEGRKLWSHNEFVPNNYTDGMHILSSQYFDHGSGSVVTDPEGGSNHVLQVFYKAGSHWRQGGPEGLAFYATPIFPIDSMTLSYDLYFDRDFDFREGGLLPGLFGGALGCYGSAHSQNCFSTRFTWLSDGYGEMEARIPDYHHQAPGFCNHTSCSSDVYPLGQKAWRFQRGVWQTIAQKVHLNTPGQADGSIEVWHNRTLVYAIDNVALRTRSNVRINGIFFSAFFKDPASSMSPFWDCFSYFKNVVLSDETPHYTIIG